MRLKLKMFTETFGMIKIDSTTATTLKARSISIRQITSGSVRIVRSCFLDVTTILSLLSLLFSVYQCYQEQDLVA